MITKFTALIAVFLVLSNPVLSNDSADFEDMIAQAKPHIRTDPDSAIFFADLAAQIAIERNELSQLGRAYWMIGYCYELKGSVSQSSAYYHQAGKVYAELDDLIAVTKLMEQSGRAKLNFGSYQLAIKDYARALKAITQHNEAFSFNPDHKNYQLQANILFDLGIAYKKTNQLDEAMHALLQCLGIHKLHGSLAGWNQLSKLNNEIGMLFRKMATDFNADKYYDSALVYYAHAKDISQSSMSDFMYLNNVGNVYLKRGDLDTAELYFHQAIEFLQAHDAIGVQAAIPTYNNLGIIAYHRADTIAAAQFFRQSIEINARDYTYQEIIRDLHQPLILNNTEELVISYQYLENLNNDVSLSPLLARIEQLNRVEKSAKMQEAERTYHEEMAHMEYEAMQAQKAKVYKILIVSGVVFALLAVLIGFLLVQYRKYQADRRFREEVKERVFRNNPWMREEAQRLELESKERSS